MKWIIAVVISSIIIISIPGNTADSPHDTDLLGGGSKSVMLNQIKMNKTNVFEWFERNRKFPKRSPGGDGGIGSVGWWLLGYNRLDETKIEPISESPQDNSKRLMKRSLGGDGGVASVAYPWLFGYRVQDSEFTQDNLKRNKRSAPINIVGKDGSSGSDQFSTSTETTTTQNIDQLRWKWLATVGHLKCIEKYQTDPRCWWRSR